MAADDGNKVRRRASAARERKGSGKGDAPVPPPKPQAKATVGKRVTVAFLASVWIAFLVFWPFFTYYSMMKAHAPLVVGDVDVADPRFLALFPEGTEMKLVFDDGVWLEGPVWVSDPAKLQGTVGADTSPFIAFSDTVNNMVLRVSAPRGPRAAGGPSPH